MNLGIDVVEKIKTLVEVNKKLTQLHWIVAQIAGENDLNTMYNLILNGFMQIAEVPGCQFVLLDENRQPLKSIGRGITPNQSESEACLALQFLTEPVPTCQKYCGSCKINCSIDSLQNIFLYGRNGNPLAVIFAFSNEPLKVSEETNMILELFTLQVSLALENAILNKKLQDLSETDALTGLYNHRYFAEHLQKDVAKCLGQNKEVCLLMLDVDNFKGYNDTFGHPAGDLVLQTLAKLFLRYSRPFDIVARYGGEEFAFILPNTKLHQGIAQAEKIRQAIAETIFEHRKVTVSIGVANSPTNTSNASELLQLADQALYYAKSSGRNKISSALPSYI